MLKNIGYLFLIFCYLSLPSYGKEALRFSNTISSTFILDYSTENDFTAHIIIYNQSPIELKNWMLGFTFQRIVEDVSEAKIVKQIGDYYLLSGTDNNKNIPPNSSVSFILHGKFTIKKYADVPAGYFIIYSDNNQKLYSPIAIQNKFVIPIVKTKPETIFMRNIIQNNTPIENNPVQPSDTLSTRLVPQPVEIQLSQGQFSLNTNTVINVVDGDKEAMKIADLLIRFILPTTGYELPIKQLSSWNENKNTIFLTTRKKYPTLGNEGYLLKVTSRNIIITANTENGLFYGVQSLRQLFPPQIFSQVKSSNVDWKIQNVFIKDYPRFSYRGVLLDVSRHFFDVVQIKRLLDLIAMHKLNTFHWHLTDDEGWRIEIKRYPQLTNIGAWRGYQEILPPALGSGINRYGGFYTQDEIREIVKYAADRYITIIPEIDMPGHARALIQSLADQLIDKNDHTHYSSVRGFHDNVLSPCLPVTYEIIENILNEVITLFPGKYIHIGGDERPTGAWEQSPACIHMMQQLGLKDTHQLQNYFSKKIQSFLASKNKAIGGWEEMMEGGDLLNHPLPLIYTWLGKHKEDIAVKKNYDVILTPYQYLYLELTYSPDSDEPGDDWGGYVDTFKTYSYTPIQPNFPAEYIKNIKGIEGGLWTEYIDSENSLDYFAFPKMVALSEVAWSQASKRNWNNFSTRLGMFHLPRLDYLNVLYRLSPPGFNHQSGKLDANNEFRGLALRYAVDGSIPSMSSTLYVSPIDINPDKIKMRAFNIFGRGN